MVQLLDGRRLYTLLYEGSQSKDNESREKVFKQVISRTAVHHALIVRTVMSTLSNHNCVCVLHRHLCALASAEWWWSHMIC